MKNFICRRNESYLSCFLFCHVIILCFYVRELNNKFVRISKAHLPNPTVVPDILSD